MATNAKIETGDPALAIALCWFAVFYSTFMIGYWLWTEYFGIQRHRGYFLSFGYYLLEYRTELLQSSVHFPTGLRAFILNSIV